MSRYKPYPKYKESGIEWLGEVPEHWEILQLRHLVYNVSNGTTEQQVKQDKEKNIVAVSRIETISKGIIDYDKVGYIKYKPELYHFKLNKNDILFSHINSLPMIGNCAIYDAKKVLYHGMNLLRLQPNSKIYPLWLISWLKSGLVRQNIESASKPAINQASISIDSLKSRYVLTPPLQEQTAIANFLDRETAKIDTLIAKQEQLIELLQEKRQALISHTVTKGLNPNVRMKDSGISWIGKIPEHWNVSRFKFHFSFTKGLTITKANLKDKGIPCVSYGEIHSKYGFEVSTRINKLQCVDKEYLDSSKTSLISKGDFIFADTSEDIEGAGNFTHLIDNEPIFAGYHTIIARKNNSNNSSRFFAYLFDSIPFRTQIRLAVKGIKVFSITQAILKDTNIWFPNSLEQQQIADYLDTQTAKIDTLITKAKQAIELLRERREALISAAVTGKIDLREESL